MCAESILTGLYDHSLRRESMRKWLLLLCGICFFGIAVSASAADKVRPDTTLYIEGLESLVQENTVLAESSFMKLIDQYPRSIYSAKASRFLDELQNHVDNSGIVTFYLGNLATATYTAMMVPTLFDIDNGALTYGLAGIAGVGLGLAGSASMAADYPITAGLSWWITSAQLISLGNYFYLNGIIDLRDLVGDASSDVFLGGQLLTLNGSLIGSYFALRDKNVSKGKGSFILQSYLWANAYYWMGTVITDRHDPKINSTIGIAVTDLALAGSFSLWDKLRWRPMRTGLVSVGGLGGALLGWFSTMIVDEIVPLESSDKFSIIMGSSIAGQAITIYLTSDLRPEPDYSGTDTANRDEHGADDATSAIAFFPVRTDDGDTGMRLLCSVSM